MTDEEYIKLLKQRGNTRLLEHQSYINFSGTAITSNTSYKYGVDYNLGDFVSIVDEQLGVVFGLQITGITKSLTSTGEEKFDLQFGTEKITVQQIVKRRNL
jgi:hypothetical protein